MRPPPISREELAALREREVGPDLLARFFALRVRMRDAAYALTTSAVPFCGNAIARELGALLGSEDSFAEPTVRRIAGQTFGLKEGLTLLHVTPGSPLDRAGARAADAIRSLDGRPVTTAAALGAVLAETTQDARALPLVLARAGRSLQVEVTPVPACAIPVAYVSADRLLPAGRDGTVVVPFGLLHAFGDDELGIAIAHQMAHRLLELGAAASDDPEASADRLGLLLAAAAGYDVRRAVPFWERIAREVPDRIGPPSGRLARPALARNLHGGIARRLAGIEATVRELDGTAGPDARPAVPTGLTPPEGRAAAPRPAGG